MIWRVMRPSCCSYIRFDIVIWYRYQPEHGDVVGDRPSDDERRVRRPGDFGHFVDHGRRLVEPDLRYPDFVLEFEIIAGFRFGDQQQIVEQKQMAILTVHSLQIRKRTFCTIMGRRCLCLFEIFCSVYTVAEVVYNNKWGGGGGKLTVKMFLSFQEEYLRLVHLNGGTNAVN